MAETVAAVPPVDDMTPLNLRAQQVPHQDAVVRVVLLQTARNAVPAVSSETHHAVAVPVGLALPGALVQPAVPGHQEQPAPTLSDITCPGELVGMVRMALSAAVAVVVAEVPDGSVTVPMTSEAAEAVAGAVVPVASVALEVQAVGDHLQPSFGTTGSGVR